MDRRRSIRIPRHLAFDVYFRTRHFGRFWTRDTSQDGLFLMTRALDSIGGGVLELRFDASGSAHRIRGVVIHRVPEQGVGIQLAYWRPDDRAAHAAYIHISGCSRTFCERVGLLGKG